MPFLPALSVRATPRSVDRRPRTRPILALASLTLLLTPAAGGAVAATPSPKVSPTPAPTPLPVAPSFRAILSLSSSGGTTIALRELGNDQLELLIGRGVDLHPAPGVRPLSGSRVDIPRAHAGTDAAGNAVVIYPRCAVPAPPAVEGRGLCDLYAYDVAAGKERLLPGVRRPQRHEYEGVMDRGAVLYAASGPGPARTGLWYRPAGGIERRLAKNPGRQLALQGARVAHVITDGVKDAGEEPCENSTLVLRSTTRPGTGQVLGRECLYPSWTSTPSDAWATPSFSGNRLVWTRDAGSGPSLFRYDVRRRKLEEARAGRVYGFAPTSANAGLALVLTADTTGSDDEPAANEVRAIDGIRWTPRAKTLIKERLYVFDDSLA